MGSLDRCHRRMLRGRSRRALLASTLFRREPGHQPSAPLRTEARRLLGYSAPISAYQFLNAFILRLDLIMLAWFIGRAPGVNLTTVGVYSAVVDLGSAARKVNQAFYPIFAPVVAGMTATGAHDRAAATYGQLAQWMLWILLPIVAVMTLAGVPILLIYGSAFGQGGVWLGIVAVACATNAFIGLGETVIMVQRPRLNLLHSSITCALAIGLNLWLIPRFGVTGAAFGILVPYLVQGILRYSALAVRFPMAELPKIHRPAGDCSSHCARPGLNLSLPFVGNRRTSYRRRGLPRHFWLGLALPLALEQSRHMKNVFLTGASSGIGLATAHLLLARGHEVWGTSRDPGRLPTLPHFHPVQLDLRDSTGLNEAVHRSLQEAGRFDVFINNAGSGRFGPAESLAPADLADEFQVLFFAHVRLMQLALAHMRTRQSGLIINVTSLASRLPVPFMAAYNAAKAAMAAFTLTTQLELPGSGIRLVDLQPADISTQFNDAVTRTPVDPIYEAGVNRTWRAVDHNMKAAPKPELVARQILRLIEMDNPPPRVTSGDRFQAGIAPLLLRFLPQRTLLWGLKKYYGL